MTRYRREVKKSSSSTKYIAIKNLIVKPTSCGRCFFCSGIKNSIYSYCTLLDCLSYDNATSLIADNDMLVEDTTKVKKECPLVEIVGNELKN